MRQGIGKQVAREISPIPPALASGEILKNGTAVVTTLIGFAVCALAEGTIPVINRAKAESLRAVDIIVLF